MYQLDLVTHYWCWCGHPTQNVLSVWAALYGKMQCIVTKNEKDKPHLSEIHPPCKCSPTLSPLAGDLCKMPTTVLSSPPTIGGTVHETPPNSLLGTLSLTVHGTHGKLCWHASMWVKPNYSNSRLFSTMKQQQIQAHKHAYRLLGCTISTNLRIYGDGCLAPVYSPCKYTWWDDNVRQSAASLNRRKSTMPEVYAAL